MTIAPEKLTYGIFRFEWKFGLIEETSSSAATTFISKVIKFRQRNLFRVALKNERESARLFLVATNLNKIGIKIVDVTFEHKDERRNILPKSRQMDHSKIEGSEHGNIKLFSSPLKNRIETGCHGEHNNFMFNIHVTGTVNDYVMEQRDSLLKEQIWSSVKNLVGTDFELIVEGKKYPVHKFILAARSAVFAELFKTNVTELEHTIPIDGVDSICLEQFLKFVYTGELDGPINSIQLMHLARHYQIKTLEELCESSLNTNNVDDEMTMLDITTATSMTEINPHIEMEADFLSEAIEIRYIWNLDWWVREATSTEFREASFEFQTHFFFGSFQNFTKLYQPKENENMCSVHLRYKYPPNNGAVNYRADEVAYSIKENKNHFNRIKMNMHKRIIDSKIFYKTFHEGGYLQVPFSTPFSITFHVKLVSKVLSLNHRFVDSTWKEQLWTAATNKTLTDVDFLVGDVSFSAHRSILSTRSPVFAAMFTSGMKECLTGKVLIDDADPALFHRFLEFIYTGTLAASFDNEELFVLADKYQVTT